MDKELITPVKTYLTRLERDGNGPYNTLRITPNHLLNLVDVRDIDTSCLHLVRSGSQYVLPLAVRSIIPADMADEEVDYETAFCLECALGAIASSGKTLPLSQTTLSGLEQMLRKPTSQ